MTIEDFIGALPKVQARLANRWGHEQAADACQDALVSLLERPQLMEKVRNAEAYLTTSATNNLRDLYRHEQARERFLERAGNDLPSPAQKGGRITSARQAARRRASGRS